MRFKMHWLVQLGLQDHTLRKIKEALDDTNSSYTFFGFTKEEIYTGLDYELFKQHNKFISMSYIKALKLSRSEYLSEHNFSEIEDLSKKEINNIINKIQDSYFYENPNNFDQYYYENLKLPMVNSDRIFLQIQDNLNAKFSSPKFIKPSSDTKAFNGGVIEANETIEEYINRTPRQSYWMQEIALISELKEIDKEYRFFVLKDQVLTGSMYMDNKVVTVSSNVPHDVWQKAEEYAKLYMPSELFGMDIAVMKNGEYRIMEYNPFNCCGIYDCDMRKVFSTLNEYYKD